MNTMWTRFDNAPETCTINPRLTLPGGVRLDVADAQPTTDEAPFLLKAARVIKHGGVRVLGVRL